MSRILTFYKITMIKFLLIPLVPLFSFADAVGLEMPGHFDHPPQESESAIYQECNKTSNLPGDPAEKFLNIHGDNDIAITSFVAQCSNLKEVYIWMLEEATGLISAQIVQGGPYGTVIANGNIAGRTKGKQQVLFSGQVFLNQGEIYYLKFFKGEPATIKGALARAAVKPEGIEGFNGYFRLSHILAHELVWGSSGPPSGSIVRNEKKNFPAGYVEKLNLALNANKDLFGEEVLASREGPTYENVKNYLTPLKLMGTTATESGVYYIPFGRPMNLSGYGPVALHVGDGSQIISQSSAGAKTTVFVGNEGIERYGYSEARLEEEKLEDGYQPILINEYTDGQGIRYVQESFSDYMFSTTELVSFIKIRVDKGKSTHKVARLDLWFSDKDLVFDQNILRADGLVRAVFSPGAKLVAGNRISYELNIADGAREIYVARLLHPSVCGLTEMSRAVFDGERSELKEYWDGELAKGASLEVPEQKVNEARKNLLIQNLYMGYLYSIGNLYETWYQVEGNDAAEVMGQHGYTRQQRAIHEVLLSRPPRKYRNWEIGELMAHIAQYFYLTGDTTFIHAHKNQFLGFMADFERQMSSPESRGVLDMANFSGDIDEKLVYLHHQASAWRGMRDMANVIKNLGDVSNGNKYLLVAEQLRERLVKGIDQSKSILPDSSVFIPTELFKKTKPLPYEQITKERYSSYWNLCFPYAAASGILDEKDLNGYYKYLKNHGAFLLGMVRFNYYPVAVGDYRRDGLPGYKTTGVDNVYGPNISRVVNTLDDPDQLVLSFYGKLAHGMTRNTFISGEGDTVGPYPDEYYRTMYLSPSSFNNSWFLQMLRLMLIAETDNKDTGTPEQLHLAYSTPRAWLEPGKSIKIADAPTRFGKLNYRIDSFIDKGLVKLNISLPENVAQAKKVSIRLRTPDKKSISSVLVNGVKHKDFDQDKETINLTGKRGVLDVKVRYHN